MAPIPIIERAVDRKGIIGTMPGALTIGWRGAPGRGLGLEKIWGAKLTQSSTEYTKTSSNSVYAFTFDSKIAK